MANLASPEYGDAMFGEQTQQAAKVFAPNDVFGVLPDGTAWLARGTESGGLALAGRPVDPGPPRQYPRSPSPRPTRIGSWPRCVSRGSGSDMPQDLRSTYPFAERSRRSTSALGRPNGEVWLQRPRAQEERQPGVRRVRPQGGLAAGGRAFPKGVTLAGFGPGGAVYGSIKESDGPGR